MLYQQGRNRLDKNAEPRETAYQVHCSKLKAHCSRLKKMICVIATINLVEGRRDEFLEEFRKIVPLVREEMGCIEYTPMIDIPTEIDAQAQPVESVAFVVEKWESVDALEAHLMAPHMLDYRKRVKNLVTGAEIRILEPA